LRNVKRVAISEAGRHTFRDSPFSAVDNVYPLELRIDGESGQVIPPGQRAAIEIGIRYQLRPDENRILLDPVTVKGLRETLGILQPEQLSLKTVVEALLDLPKSPLLLPRGLRPALEAGTGVDGTLVLPPPDPSVLKFNRRTLKSGDMGVAAMTVLMGGDSMAVKHWYSVGTLSLDAEGRIVGTSLGRPDFQSPRGTQYRRGINIAAEEVPVILLHNTVIWQGPLGGLNPKQQSAMLALFESCASQRAKALEEDPYAVDVILGEGLGKMAQDLGSYISRSKYRWNGVPETDPVILNLKVVRDPEGQLSIRTDRTQELGPVQNGGNRGLGSEKPSLGRIQIQFQAISHQGLRGKPGSPRFESFDFKVEPGMEQEKAIRDLLDFLKKTLLRGPGLGGVF